MATPAFLNHRDTEAQSHRRRKPQGRKERQDIAHRNSTQRRPVRCSAGVPPAPHALMQACWIRVLSTPHRRREAGATKALESSRHAPSKRRRSDLSRHHQGRAAVLRVQRPWDRAGGTKTCFRNDSTIPRWRRSETVSDSAAQEPNPRPICDAAMNQYCNVLAPLASLRFNPATLRWTADR